MPSTPKSDGFRVLKSSRHSKITGDFAERLVLYLLSKYGSECMYVDHVGMDIVARNPHTHELMGISVKSRSRNTGTEGTYISIPIENLEKLEGACETFGCVPYFSIVADEADTIAVYLISAHDLVELHEPGEKVISWKMSDSWKEKYKENPKIKMMTMRREIFRWWGSAG